MEESFKLVFDGNLAVMNLCKLTYSEPIYKIGAYIWAHLLCQ